MTSIAVACLWFVIAILRAMFPSRDHHWRFAYVMIAAGIPILIWVYMQNGGLVAVIAVLAAASVLRWPLIYMWRWFKARLATN